jgi:hemolysin activation/secretion protein
LGRGRFQFFPLKYYGIGANTPNNYAIVSNGNIQIRERALRKVKENFYVGLEVDYHKIFDVSYDLSKVGGDFELPQGSNGSSNKALGIGIVYDNRKNVLNVRKGMFAELAFLQYAKAFNSDFQFQLFQFDARIFRRGFAKNQVIAIQSNGVSNVGNVPFNQMALIGGESMMRGYYLGRFRDKTMVNLQAEYRFLPLPFSKKLGATLFSSIGNVAPSVQSLNISNTKFAAGLGLRYLVFKAKDIYFRTDLAFTNEGRGFYVFLGEAF